MATRPANHGGGQSGPSGNAHYYDAIDSLVDLILRLNKLPLELALTLNELPLALYQGCDGALQSANGPFEAAD